MNQYEIDKLRGIRAEIDELLAVGEIDRVRSETSNTCADPRHKEYPTLGDVKVACPTCNKKAKAEKRAAATPIPSGGS